MRKIELSKQAAWFLKELPAKQARQIAERLKALATDAEAVPSEGLKGYAPMCCLKAGEFRIVYVVEPDFVQVRLVGKCNDDEIYKVLERAFKR